MVSADFSFSDLLSINIRLMSHILSLKVFRVYHLVTQKVSDIVLYGTAKRAIYIQQCDLVVKIRFLISGSFID